MTGWLERLHLSKPTTTEENRMSQSQYGVQGSPVSVSSIPAEPTAPEVLTHPLAAPVEAVAAPVAPDNVPDRNVHDASPVEPGADFAKALAEIAALRAALTRVTGLVTGWSNMAETTLIRGDYEKGQRDATLTRSDELRTALGI